MEAVHQRVGIFEMGVLMQIPLARLLQDALPLIGDTAFIRPTGALPSTEMWYVCRNGRWEESDWRGWWQKKRRRIESRYMWLGTALSLKRSSVDSLSWRLFKDWVVCSKWTVCSKCSRYCSVASAGSLHCGSANTIT